MNAALRPTLEAAFKLSKVYETHCQRATQPYSLTQNESDVLLFLANNPTYDTAMDVVRYRAISRSLVSKSVKSLLARGYLSYEKDEKDRRSTHLRILPVALPAVKALQKAQEAFGRLLTENLTPQELAAFIATSKKLSTLLEKESKTYEHL